MLLAIVVGIPLGILSALRANTAWPTTSRSSSRTSASPCPTFLVATLLIYFFAAKWGTSRVSRRTAGTRWQSKVLPVDRARASGR